MPSLDPIDAPRDAFPLQSGEVPRKQGCKLCRYPRLMAVEKALEEGVSYNDICRKFKGVDRHSIARHLRHQRKAAKKLADAKPSPTAAEDAVIDKDALHKVHVIENGLNKILAECERRSDNRGKLAVLKVKAWCVELEQKILNTPTLESGQLHLSQMRNTYKNVKAKLLSALYDAEAYRHAQLQLAEAGYQPQQIDEILRLLGFVAPATAPYAPAPQVLLPERTP